MNSQNCSVTVCKKVIIEKVNDDINCSFKADFSQMNSAVSIGFIAKNNADDAIYSWYVEVINISFSVKNICVSAILTGTFKACLTISSRRSGCEIQIYKRVIVDKNHGTISSNDL